MQNYTANKYFLFRRGCTILWDDGLHTRWADVIMNNLNAETECGNHILPDNLVVTWICTAPLCP